MIHSYDTRHRELRHGDTFVVGFGRDATTGTYHGAFYDAAGRHRLEDMAGLYAEPYPTSFGYGVRVFRNGGYYVGVLEANAAYGLFHHRTQAEQMAERFNTFAAWHRDRTQAPTG